MKKLNFLVLTAFAVVLTFSSFKSTVAHKEKLIKHVAIDGVYVGTLTWYPFGPEDGLVQIFKVYVNVNNPSQISGVWLLDVNGQEVGQYRAATGSYSGGSVSNLNCSYYSVVDASGNLY